MSINKAINSLIVYGLNNDMINEYDIDYVVNKLLILLKLDNFDKNLVKNVADIEVVLDEFINYGITNKLITDTFSEKDIFTNKIIDCIMPRPSEVINRFNKLNDFNSKEATNYYYNLAVKSNYVKSTKKNIKFDGYFKNNLLEITINLSKPEKDPKDIAAMKNLVTIDYPKCLLCKENVGFKGDAKRASRITHRIIPIKLNCHNYYMQYSPYAYYNEHCIIFNEEHVPMKISKDTFSNLVSFVDQFSHYFIGSNADLPIVGGSILTHDHYQGGNYVFPIEKAEVIREYTVNNYSNILLQILNWPLSTIRLISDNKDELIAYAEKLLLSWRQYDDQANNIISHTKDEQHNTITPILRKQGQKYYMYLVLRNNRTTLEYPDGIFHPHKQWHHIKKENIGLIEVMGLAILPARLKIELKLVKDYLLLNKQDDKIVKHMPWIKQMQQNYKFNKDNIDEILKQEVVNIFGNVLVDCGVYKMNELGIQGFDKFIKLNGGVENESK